MNIMDLARSCIPYWRDLTHLCIIQQCVMTCRCTVLYNRDSRLTTRIHSGEFFLLKMQTSRRIRSKIRKYFRGGLPGCLEGSSTEQSDPNGTSVGHQSTVTFCPCVTLCFGCDISSMCACVSSPTHELVCCVP
jgi:hypothetical protein